MGESSYPEPMLVGPYELVECIAAGGMAEVYVATRKGPFGFNKTVAVKRILPQLAKDAEFVAMFVDEARVAATLSHPNIVQVFDFGEQDGELYMAMEFVRGTNTARLIRAAAGKGEAIPLDICLHVVLSVLRGLEHAHGARDESGALLRLVHRDVSPGNVLIDNSGAVKLTDFGIARAATFERRTAAGHLKGKLGYMSPEQVTGGELDARSDLFTVGIILAELVTQQPLFTAPTELEILTRIRDADLGVLESPRVPPDLRPVLLRALAREPADRYESASAFAEDIEKLARKRELTLGPHHLAAWLRRPHDSASMERVAVPAPEPARDKPRSASTTAPVGKRASLTIETPPSQRVTVPTAAYHVQQPDGTAFGPVMYHQMAELFATGAVTGATLISRNGGEFAEAAAFPELSRFVTSSALRWETDGTWSQRARQTLDRAILPGWLFHLAVGRKTGAILMRDGQKRKKIFLVGGVPEFSASTDKRELLGEHLIAKGKVLRVEVEMALSMLPRFGGRLGDALVGLGVLRPLELFRAIHEQTVERYLELFQWRTGEVAFDDGPTSEEETFPLGVDPVELIARGVRESYTNAEIAGWVDALGTDVVAPATSSPLRRDALPWAPGEASIVGDIDHEQPIAELVSRQVKVRGARVAEVLRALYLGLSFGVLVSPRFTARIRGDESEA